MPKQQIRISSIDGGLGRNLYDNAEGTYSAAVAIDTASQSASTILSSDSIRPVGYSKFSGSSLAQSPLWITAQPKTQNSFVLSADGKFNSFDSTITMRTTDEAGTSFPISMNGAGNGMAYYDNFIYCAGTTNIDQYGGMDQGATIARTANVWTGAKFGLTALTNTTYPAVRGVVMPNHAMHVHTDNNLYICDVLPAGAGATFANKGCIHKLSTKRTTFQGDTNNGSAYNVLDLPLGFYPTDIESYGTDLVISAIQTSGATVSRIMQGKAALFFWDTVASSFYRQVWLHDPLCTAMLNNNGNLMVFTGDGFSGSRVSVYTGGDSVQELFYFVEGVSPFPGAVDAYANRLIFGGYCSYPQDAAVVMAYGDYDSRDTQVLQNIVRSTNTGSTPTITAAKYIEQHVGVNTPRLIVGWSELNTLNYNTQTGNFTVGLTVTGGTSGATGVIQSDTDNGSTGTLVLFNVTGTFQNAETITDTSTGSAKVNGTLTGATFGLDKFSGSAGLNAEWRSQVYNVAHKFTFRKIKLNLDEAVQSGCTIVLKIYTDNNFTTAAQTLTTINNTNYSGDVTINFKRPELTAVAQQNFCIGITFTGTRATAVTLPLDIDLEVFGDDKTA